MLMIRLARFGAKKKPTYRVVVIDKERARDSTRGTRSGARSLVYPRFTLAARFRHSSARIDPSRRV